VREVLNIDLSKQQQSSDWGAQALSEAQLAYAAVRRAASPWLARTAGYHARAPRGAAWSWRKPVFEFFSADAGEARSAGLGYRGHFPPILKTENHLKRPPGPLRGAFFRPKGLPRT